MCPFILGEVWRFYMSLENPSPYEIQRVLEAWNNTREELLRHDPDPDPYTMETAALADTEKVKDLVVRLLRASKRAYDQHHQAEQMITDLEIRSRRFEKRGERFKRTALDIMQITGERRVELPEATWAVRAGQQVVKILGPVAEKYMCRKVEVSEDK